MISQVANQWNAYTIAIYHWSFNFLLQFHETFDMWFAVTCALSLESPNYWYASTSNIWSCYHLNTSNLQDSSLLKALTPWTSAVHNFLSTSPFLDFHISLEISSREIFEGSGPIRYPSHLMPQNMDPTTLIIFCSWTLWTTRNRIHNVSLAWGLHLPWTFILSHHCNNHFMDFIISLLLWLFSTWSLQLP